MYYSYIGNLLYKHNHHSFSGVVLYTEFSKLEYELGRLYLFSMTDSTELKSVISCTVGI